MTTAPYHRPSPTPGTGPGRTAPAPSRPTGVAPPPGNRFTTSIDPLRVLRRHLLLLVCAGIVGVVIGTVSFVYLNREFPSYRGEVLFHVQPVLQDAQQIAAQEIQREELVARLANTEVTVLLSRIVLEQTVQHPDILRTNWGQQYLLPGGEAINVQAAVEDLEKSVSAAAVRGTNLFRVTWRARTATDVPIVLNRLKDAYMARRDHLDAQDWARNVTVFEDDQRQLLEQIRETEEDMAAFIRQHRLVHHDDIRTHHESLMASRITDQLASVSTQLNLTRMGLQQTELKLMGTLEPDSEERFEAENHPMVRSLSARLSDLKLAQRELRERLQPDHPSMESLERRIRVVELEREESKREVIRTILEARLRQFRDAEERLRALYESLQRDFEEADNQLRELAAHAAAYQTLEARRDRLEMQREENRMLLDHYRLIRQRVDSARVRVAQDAFTPTQKAFPQPHIIIPLGTLATLFVTVGVIFLREVTDQRIKSASDLAVVPGTKLLGVIPDIVDDPVEPSAAELVVRDHPMSVMAESYRQACATLMRPIERGGYQTILFMGGLPGAGTTTAITNIASSMAASGKRVLVVDSNFRRPGLAKAMGVPAEGPGLGDLLAGAASIDDVIVNGVASGNGNGVSVMRAGTPTNRVIERLNNGNFESLVAELRGRYDLILFDAPPAIVAGDAMVLANRLDAALLVVRANQEQKGLVARVLGQLSDARCESLGVLLNRPRGTAGGYFKQNFRTMAKYAKK